MNFCVCGKGTGCRDLKKKKKDPKSDLKES